MRLASGNTLSALLEQKSMSQARLARYVECHRSFINHLVRGRKKTCTPRRAELIAEALDVPREILFLTSPSINKSQTSTKKGKVHA